MEIPLRNKHKTVIAHAIIDERFVNDINNVKWHSNHGYPRNTKLGFMHHYILRLADIDYSTLIVDHLNNNKLDNRLCNLHCGTYNQNNQNINRDKNKTSSKFIGVSFNKKCKNRNWTMSIKTVKQEQFYFNIEAHAAYYYDLKAIEYYGPHANINGIDRPMDFELPKEKAIRQIKTKPAIIKTPNIIEDGNNVIYLYNKHNQMKTKTIIDINTYEKIKFIKWYQSGKYVSGIVNGKTTKLHRFLLNPSGKDIIDHINNDSLDNRISNLRLVNHAENSQNRQPINKYKGVVERSGKFRSHITHKYKIYCLGTFDTAEMAAKAYDIKAMEFYGLTARLNFPKTTLKSGKNNTSLY